MKCSSVKIFINKQYHDKDLEDVLVDLKVWQGKITYSNHKY